MRPCSFFAVAARTGAFVALCLAALASEAGLIQINTGLAGKGLNPGDLDPSVTWNYTGSDADPVFPSYVGVDFGGSVACHFVGGVCRTSNNSAYGAGVPAGYPAYLGVQFFYLAFDLPANATNVVMRVTEVGADDRIGLHLNGNEIGFWGNVRFATLPGDVQLGRMDGSDRYAASVLGAGSEPTRTSGVPFHDPFIQPDFDLTDPGLFNRGGSNLVRLWVNNTGVRNNSAVARAMSFGDPSVAGFSATITYDLAIPEPGSLALCGFGTLGMLARRRRSRVVSAAAGEDR